MLCSCFQCTRANSAFKNLPGSSVKNYITMTTPNLELKDIFVLRSSSPSWQNKTVLEKYFVSLFQLKNICGELL